MTVPDSYSFPNIDFYFLRWYYNFLYARFIFKISLNIYVEDNIIFTSLTQNLEILYTKLWHLILKVLQSHFREKWIIFVLIYWVNVVLFSSEDILVFSNSREEQLYVLNKFSKYFLNMMLKSTFKNVVSSERR